jgi:hypothetical protein
MVLPLEDGTTSPLMKRPSGCSYVCPLGVVIFLKRDMTMMGRCCLDSVCLTGLFPLQLDETVGTLSNRTGALLCDCKN